MLAAKLRFLLVYLFVVLLPAQTARADGFSTGQGLSTGNDVATPVSGFSSPNVSGFIPTQLVGLVEWLRSDRGVTYAQGPIVATGTTPPAVTFTGTPVSSTNTIVLTCDVAGTQTTAHFQWTLNGVSQTGFTSAATVVLTGTGITANFPVGAYTNTPSADTYSSVVTVSAWADQSGVGDTNHNAAQATASAQPVFTAVDASYNSKPSLDFTAASTQRLFTGTWSAAPAQPITVFVVGEIGASGTYIIDGLSNNTLGYATASSNRVQLEAGSSLPSGSNVYTAGASGKALFGGIFAASSQAMLFLNSSTALVTGNAGVGPATGLSIGCAGGGGSCITGKVVEVIAVSGSMSAPTRSLVAQYLAAEYSPGSWN